MIFIKKYIKCFISVLLCLCLIFPITAYASIGSANISGSNYPKAGNTYTYRASYSSKDGTTASSYKWSLSGIAGGSISESGSSCKLSLSNSAKGYGTLSVTITGSDGSTISKNYGLNVVAATTTTTTTTTTKKAATTRKNSPPATTKKQGSSSGGSSSSGSSGGSSGSSSEQTATTRAQSGGKKEATTRKDKETTTETTETTTAEVSEAKTAEIFADIDNVLSLEISTDNNDTVTFKWQDDKSQIYNLYLTTNGKDYYLVYSGSSTTYKINKLKKGGEYKAVVESTNIDGDEIITNGCSKNIDFQVKKTK